MVNLNIPSSISGLFGNKSASAASSQNPTSVSNQLLTAFGSQALTANTQPQTVQLLPDYYNLPMSSIKFSLSVTDTAGTTAPTGMNVIETVLKNLQIQTASGTNLTLMDGTQFDLSLSARYLTAGGVYNAAPAVIGTLTASSAVTYVWNIILPLSVRP